MAQAIELGLDTFGDVTAGADGALLSHAQVLRNVVDEAVLADEVGVDFIGVGEHHRDDFAVSAPEVILAGIATRTKRIRLGSAVTVLSSDDPIRVFQRFSTVDALSNGRAEVILGRGSFTESFPLFGFDLKDYETLFSEKLDLFASLLRDNNAPGGVNWQGKGRPPLKGQHVFPPVEAGTLKTWIGVGGSPESVVRAARYGLPLMLAIIGGNPARFAPYVDLYHKATGQLGGTPQPIGVHSHGYVAETDEAAREEVYADYKRMHDRIGAERGWPAYGRDAFLREIEHGSLYLGSPETVARKIAKTVKALGAQRFDMKYSAGTLSHGKMMRAIELYGTKVIPRVRELLSEETVEA
ncbi:LLM class flavin-dependent oxidoreductase [Starkeya koreensis]|uniref:LLM class flavin-dependent oxidoreductase n=1 Tax=Ancylobacter koreensis TaxID=266121 RepID=A0ABT0DJV5_9HYPH|nr:LLM class flavin-dependent oxidoreductase [Ancylobacter koreensis]MCK0207566.1 LLM class flavin-dependent oxidoreductase [Ancylobacter koreensis]